MCNRYKKCSSRIRCMQRYHIERKFKKFRFHGLKIYFNLEFKKIVAKFILRILKKFEFEFVGNICVIIYSIAWVRVTCVGIVSVCLVFELNRNSGCMLTTKKDRKTKKKGKKKKRNSC